MLNKKYCQKCGSPTDNLSANFCGSCGAPFNSAIASVSTPSKSLPVVQKAPTIVPSEDDIPAVSVDELNTEELGFELPAAPVARTKTKMSDLIGSKSQNDTETIERPKLKKVSKKAFLETFREEAGGGDKKIKPIDIE